MNFFQAQEKAKRNTALLVFLFICAVLILITLTNVLVNFLLAANMDMGIALSPIEISLVVLGVITIAITYKYLSLKGGGRVIAEMLGGRLIPSDTQNRQHRQLLNIVQEMALAAGMPAPPVYLIPEQSINAFAAGLTQRDAVIGINQGTLDLLNRSELQGVVAHEFSHILNGDMSLNLRLIAILHGIVFIGIIGYSLLRGAAFQRKNAMPLFALGLGLVIIGFGGLFFGNLIKASVSRQREYLADASAVQFTRLQSGIANALKKIGGHAEQSHLRQKNAEQASHMFFGSILPKFSSGLMATHPPLEKRILAIDPSWNGNFVETLNSSGQETQANSFSKGPRSSNLVSNFSDQIGQINEASLDKANQFLTDLPGQIATSTCNVFEARALIYALLLSKDETLRQKQLLFLAQKAEKGVPECLNKLLNSVNETNPSDRFNLALMTVPTLKQLSKAQYRIFSSNINELIVSDGKVDLFEWTLHRVLTQSLYSQFENIKPARGRIKNLLRIKKDIAELLSILASHSDSSEERCRKSYESAARSINLDLAFKHIDYFDFRQLNSLIETIRELSPGAKKQLIDASYLCIQSDKTVTLNERVLLQGICAALDCPLPFCEET